MQGPPPGLAAMMGMMGGGQGAPPSQPQPTTDPEELLRKIVDDANMLIAAEPDDADTASFARGLAIFQGVLAKRQQARHAALGVSPAVQAMGRNGG